MRKLILVALATIFAASLAMSSAAQDPTNVSVTHLLYYTYKHRLMPTEPQDPLFFRYGVDIRSEYLQPLIEEKLRIAGQQKIDDYTADDYILKYRLDDVVVNPNSKIVDKPRFDWEFRIKYKIAGITLEEGRNRDDLKEILPVRYVYGGEQTFTKTFEKEEEARAYGNIQKNWETIKSDVIQNLVETTVNELTDHASKRWGFPINTHTMDQLKAITTKKHSEYEAMNAKVQNLKARLESLDGTTPLTEDDLSDYIDYFKALPERFPSDSKADMKIRYCGYYDLVEIYSQLDMPAEAIVWAEKLTANGFEPKQGIKLKARAERMIETFANSFYKCRQFDTTPQLDALPPRL